jgi:hypothetical protein
MVSTLASGCGTTAGTIFLKPKAHKKFTAIGPRPITTVPVYPATGRPSALPEGGCRAHHHRLMTGDERGMP